MDTEHSSKTSLTSYNWAMALKQSADGGVKNKWKTMLKFEYILWMTCLAFQPSCSTMDKASPQRLTKHENESLSLSSEAPTSCRCSENLCLSEECILAASTVLSSLDRTADPCEDFYQFACGGWIQKSVSSNTDRYGSFGSSNTKNSSMKH